MRRPELKAPAPAATPRPYGSPSTSAATGGGTTVNNYRSGSSGGSSFWSGFAGGAAGAVVGNALTSPHHTTVVAGGAAPVAATAAPVVAATPTGPAVVAAAPVSYQSGWAGFWDFMSSVLWFIFWVAVIVAGIWMFLVGWDRLKAYRQRRRFRSSVKTLTFPTLREEATFPSYAAIPRPTAAPAPATPVITTPRSPTLPFSAIETFNKIQLAHAQRDSVTLKRLLGPDMQMLAEFDAPLDLTRKADVDPKSVSYAPVDISDDVISLNFFFVTKDDSGETHRESETWHFVLLDNGNWTLNGIEQNY